jgi:Replication-relaxation
MGEIKRSAKRTARRAIVITERDLVILRYLHDFRLLRIEQLEVLTGRTYTRVHRRLKGLFDAGFLNRIEAPQKKDIYHLGRPAFSLLLLHGLITDDEAERRSREHELKPATLNHEMLIADTHVMLQRACVGPIQLVTWREGETIRDTFEVGGQQTVTIQPDALFELEDSRLPAESNRVTFFVENDRSTMPIQIRPGSRRFGDKIERYCLFIERRRPKEYGAKGFRIVTLTLTRERRDNLCADTEVFLVKNNLTHLRKFFLFGSLKDVAFTSPEMVLESIFRRPGDSKPYPLVPGACRKNAECLNGARKSSPRSSLLEGDL